MDPQALSNQIREQMESFFVKGMEEMVRNAQTLQSVGKGMEVGLQGKQMADAAMRKYLELLNLPTREDIAAVLQYLQKIESRVIGLEEKIEDVSTSLAKTEKAVKKCIEDSLAAKPADPVPATPPPAAPVQAAPAAPAQAAQPAHNKPAQSPKSTKSTKKPRERTQK